MHQNKRNLLENHLHMTVDEPTLKQSMIHDCKLSIGIRIDSLRWMLGSRIEHFHQSTRVFGKCLRNNEIRMCKYLQTHFHIISWNLRWFLPPLWMSLSPLPIRHCFRVPVFLIDFNRFQCPICFVFFPTLICVEMTLIRSIETSN